MDIKKVLEDKKYFNAYSEKELLKKIVEFAKTAGIKLIYVVLVLFYVVQSKDTPKWAKNLIYSALGYFILPIDISPDFIPGIGQIDDWLILMAALGAVAVYVTEETKNQAKEKLHTWFGDYDSKDLEEVDEKITEKVH